MHRQSYSNLDDHYDAIVDMAPQHIIQQYEDETQGPEVSL